MRRLLTISLLLLFCWLNVQGQTEAVPIKLQAPLLLKAMKFERNFEGKMSGSPKEVVIGVVYQEKSRRSSQAREAFETNIKNLNFDHPIRVLPLPLDENDELPETLDWSAITIIYIAPVRGVDLEMITAKTQQHDVISSSGIAAFSNKGVTITFDLVQDRPKFVINRSSAEAEGCDFSAQLLKLAIIR